MVLNKGPIAALKNSHKDMSFPSRIKPLTRKYGRSWLFISHPALTCDRARADNATSFYLARNWDMDWVCHSRGLESCTWQSGCDKRYCLCF